MSVSLKPVAQQTLVITGATSGIGLSTALEAASRGARLVLVARSPDGLDQAAEQCRARGASVETLAADVADRATLDLVHDRAHEAFGGFDTWVNNAGASAYGLLWDVPLNDARQVFETNYWGTVNGSLAAVAHFRERGASGALINVGSVLSDRAIPLQGHYAASKHAIKGFTDALRMELEKEGLPVSVTLIKPSSIATPYPEHAANYMDREPKMPEPAYAPEIVAGAILSAAERPVRDITVGAKDGIMGVLGTLAPRLTDKIMEATLFDQQKADRPADGDRRGTLFEPDGSDIRQRGDAQRVLESSPYTYLQRKPLAAAGVAAAAGIALALLNRD